MSKVTKTNSKKKNITSKDDNLLHMAGIRGVDYYTELFIYTSLFLGDPTCLIGRPGTAKTEVVKVLGQALNTYYRNKAKENPSDNPKVFNYHIYDASKLNFDELVGYPDPNKLRQGLMDFIPTKNTIWGKDLVGFDEINRCTQETQNALLEVIRSRTCNGINTNTNFIFGTMNPYGGVATSNMVEALVDRFTYFLYFQDFDSMTDEDRSHVVTRVGDVDSVGLRFWNQHKEELDFNEEEINPVLLKIGTSLHTVLSRAATHFSSMSTTYGEPVNILVNKIVDNLNTKFKDQKIKVKDEVKLSGRRVGMVYRGILAAKAVQLALYEELGYANTEMEPFLKRAIRSCIPIGISGGVDATHINMVDDVIATTVTSYWSRLCSNNKELDLLHKLTCSNNHLEKIATLLLNKDKLETMSYNTFWSSLIDSPESSRFMIKKLSDIIPGVVPPHMAVDVITKIDEGTLRTKLGVEDDITLPDSCDDYLEEFRSLIAVEGPESSIAEIGALYLYENKNFNMVPAILTALKQITKFVKNNAKSTESTSIDLAFMNGAKPSTEEENVI